MTDAQIAASLNQEGVVSAKGKCFTRKMISWIRYRYDIPAASLKGAEELTVNEVADLFGVRPGVIYYWIAHGHLPVRRLDSGKPYLITLEPEKKAELRAWVANSNRMKPSQVQNPATSGAI
jgi:excisionase family DNA binding protein